MGEGWVGIAGSNQVVAGGVVGIDGLSEQSPGVGGDLEGSGPDPERGGRIPRNSSRGGAVEGGGASPPPLPTTTPSMGYGQDAVQGP